MWTDIVIIVSSHITYLSFLACSLPFWDVFRTDLFELWLCAIVSSYGHVRNMPFYVTCVQHGRLSLTCKNIYIDFLDY